MERQLTFRLFYCFQISVKDLNDNRPIFEQTVYNATIRESLPIGASIVTLRASDLDYDANGKVTYILESKGEENFFRIDANSGVISLRSALDREQQAQHVLTIVATGKPTRYLMTDDRMLQMTELAPHKKVTHKFLAKRPELKNRT